jgi:hypothetical protein
MRLYIEGHNHRRGYAVSVECSDEEVRSSPVPSDTLHTLLPVRFYADRNYAKRVVQRFNSRFGH